MRKARRKNQDEVAAAIGVSRTAIGGYEAGRIKPSLAALAALTREFRIDLATLQRVMDDLQAGRTPTLEPPEQPSTIGETAEPYRVDAKRQRYPWAPDDLLQRWARAEQLADFALREQYEIDRLIEQHRRRALEQQQRNSG